jgi:FixJ family two-component response regulator
MEQRRDAMSSATIQVNIVDDEPSVRSALARLIRSANMTAHVFASVDEFMVSGVADENACVVSDVRMPGNGGLELLALLARAGRSLPVIIITANDTPEVRAMAERLGCAAYFRKPVDAEPLLNAIARALRRRES